MESLLHNDLQNKKQTKQKKKKKKIPQINGLMSIKILKPSLFVLII